MSISIGIIIHMKQRYITAGGITLTIKDWAQKNKITSGVIRTRLSRGVPEHLAVTYDGGYNEENFTMDEKKRKSAKAKKPAEEAKSPLQTAIETRTNRKQTASQKSQIDALVNELERTRKELDASLILKGVDPRKEIAYQPLTNDTESIAVALASDWHIEELVRKSWSNGLNEYNLTLAEKYAELYFVNLLKLVEKERASTKIDTLVLALLGDFITGNLHLENLETCQLRPIEATLKAEQWLIEGIKYLLNNSDLNLIIPCSVGNHSRITEKVHFATERGNSLEYMMYYHMANHFVNEPRVRFYIPDSYLGYLDLKGYVLCFSHGHGIRYGGAYGGITTSVVKKVRAWEQAHRADLYVFGHHHTQLDGGFFMANGSLIGYGARSAAFGYGFEPRQQTFFLVNLKYRRKSVVVPIWFQQ